MSHEIRQERFTLTLGSLRWIFVAAPLTSLIPLLGRWTWPLAVLALVSSIPLVWLPRYPDWLLPTGLLTLTVTASALWALMPPRLNTVILYTGAFYSARFLSRWHVLAAVLIAILGFATMLLRYQDALVTTLFNLAILAAVVLLGLHRRDRQLRIEQTELALARAQTAAEEHAVAAALAERARIARELHDVLAHSLSGLALNLQGAKLMLLRDGASDEAVMQIERAQRLASEGLAEARRAVAALRDDPVPLDRAIADLLTGYCLNTSARAELMVRGEPREVETATGATVLRAVQEALANTRKHAPGSAVEVTLGYAPACLEVTVLDHQGRPAKNGPAGYGLLGMRERAELLGGRLSTGPGEDGWRVHLTIPA